MAASIDGGRERRFQSTALDWPTTPTLLRYSPARRNHMASQIPRTIARSGLLALFAIGLATTANAQTDASVAELGGTEALVIDDQSGDIRPLYAADDVTRRLSLAEALALSVQNNLNVEVARYEPLIVEQDMLATWGAYDPVLSADIGRNQSESPTTFLLDPTTKSQTRATDGGISLNALLPYVGATVGIEYEASENTQNSGIQRFKRQYDSGIFLTAKVPLLRGLIWSRAWTDVKVSKLAYLSSHDGFIRAVMDITESTINAYWNLVASHEKYGVELKSLETARALLGQSQTQYEVGVVSKVEVVEAEAGVANRDFNLILARNEFENAEDALVAAVFGPELVAISTFRVRAIDDPENYEARKVDVAHSVEIALSNLPELKIADQEIDQRAVELKFAKNARLPALDFTARYGFLNNSGKRNCAGLRDDIPPTTDKADCFNGLGSGNYSDSFDNFFQDDGFENYDFRGTFSIPIPNTAARRRVTRTRLDLRRARSRKARTKLDVIVAVRSASRGIQASARGIQAAERRRLAAEEQLRAERIRLEHGESTPFEVLQRESDLVDAESQKIAALQAYRTAEARLERAQGTILDTYQIQLDDVRSPGMR
ncbi:MAG TPA: TolC family protein [Myxococcales bacterium]|nr:TolC family protein [Myxococcales bacterium]